MTLLYLTTMFLIIYSSTIFATHAKFTNKGIKLDLKHKSMLFILPFFLFYIHIRAARKIYKTDKTKAFRIVLVSIAKYPVFLGAFIELLKESMVECEVFGNSRLVAIQKPKEIKEYKPLVSINWDMKEFFGNFTNSPVYEDMLIDKLATS